MSILLYNDENISEYRSFAKFIYSYAQVTYPDSSKTGVTNVLDGYSIVHGLPIMINFNTIRTIKFDNAMRPLECCFNCIDIISSMADRCGALPCKDFLNLLKRIEYLQKKAIWLDLNNNLSLDMMKLMDEQLYECYDKLLYLYICDAQDLVDYKPEWKEEHKEDIRQEFMYLWGDIYLFKNVITTSIMAKRQKHKPPYLTNYSWCYSMIHYAEQELERIF